jgi:hypothetical protein
MSCCVAFFLLFFFSKRHISIIQTKGMELSPPVETSSMSVNASHSYTAHTPQVWNNQGISWLCLIGIQIHWADVYLSWQFECLCHSNNSSLENHCPRRISSNKWKVCCFPSIFPRTPSSKERTWTSGQWPQKKSKERVILKKKGEVDHEKGSPSPPSIVQDHKRTEN